MKQDEWKNGSKGKAAGELRTNEKKRSVSVNKSGNTQRRLISRGRGGRKMRSDM